MIVFLQGLPRSGKSYESVCKYIIPALQAGREVDAYVEGLNFERIAEAAELPLERVTELLQAITRQQVETIFTIARKNALIVIDEAQNFWPTGRTKLTPEMTQFITEHGHLGQDIVLMGQVMSDVHKLWRGRVSQRNSYLKLDAVGLEKRYAVTVEKATAPERFETVSKTNGVYDPKFFGTYLSHVDSSINTANFQDARANVKNAFWVKWGIPLTVGFAAWGSYQAWSFFHPDIPKPKLEATATAQPARPAPPPPPPAPKTQSYAQTLSAKYRPRLAWSHRPAVGEPVGIVEWYDGDRVRERLTFYQLQQLGERLSLMPGDIVILGTVVITHWPVDVARELPTVGAQVIPLAAVSGSGT